MHWFSVRRQAVAVRTGFVLVLGAALFMLAGAATAGTSSFTVSGDTPGFIKKATDKGAADPSQVIDVAVWLKLHNESQLDNLVQQQRQKGSPNYHKWIDQATFDSTYSPTDQEVKSVSNFLSAHGLTVTGVAENSMYVNASGPISAVEKAFHTQIDSYTYQGVTYFSNNADPNINDSSGAHVAAVTGLDNFGFSPSISTTSVGGETAKPVPLGSNAVGSKGIFFESACFRAPQTETFKTNGGLPTATYTGNRFGADISNNTLGHLAPCGYDAAELRHAYGLDNTGYDGSGQTIVITDAFGSPTIQQDAEVYSQINGLPDLTPSNFQVLRAPGVWHNGDPRKQTASWASETTLDVEVAHALAPAAKIALVIGPTNNGSLDEAVNWAIVHHLGNVISNSWSTVEGLGNPTRFDRDNKILEQAAAEGVDVNFASGDFGDETPSFGFKTVDFPTSSPFATGVGGTSLALDSSGNRVWETGWGTNLTRIAEPVSQGSPPDDPPLNSPSLGLGFQFGAGGGQSMIYPKPSWQTGTPGTTRSVPDISMDADPFTGAELVQTIDGQLSVEGIGGTSLATPLFSAVMALATQKAGHGLGQAAPLLYGASSGAITDVDTVTSPTNVTGSITDSTGTHNLTADQLAAPLFGLPTYFSALYNSPFSTRWFVITFGTDTSLHATPGWDDVTGLGVPNGASFLNAIG